MYEHLEEAIAELHNDKSGWVTRRDAADALGNFARRSIRALEDHREDADVDVKDAVEKAIRQIALPDTTPKKDYSFADLVESCHRPPRREVKVEGECARIRLQIDKERWQSVYVETYTRKDKEQLVRVYTVVGEPSEEVIRWGLKNNGKLVHCALAQEKHEGEARLILINNFERATATPEAIKAAVKEMALYGDWIEKKISGLDEL